METTLSKAEHTALVALAEHGAVKIRADSSFLAIYDRLVSAGLAFCTALDEGARFYGLTEVGTELMDVVESNT